jgi:hypothetical protein
MTGAMLIAAAVLLLVAVRDGHCAQLCMDSSIHFLEFIHICRLS